MSSGPPTSLIHDTSPPPTTIPNAISPAAYTASPIFEDPTPLPTASSVSSARNPGGLPQNVTIILISIIPTVFCLAIIAGIVHFVHQRNKRNVQARQQANIEKRLRMARRPEMAAAASRQLSSGSRNESLTETRILTPYRAEFVMDSDVPPMPTTPETAWRLGRRGERPRALTRNTFVGPEGGMARDV